VADGATGGSPYRVARRLLGLIGGHWAVLDARLSIEAGIDIRTVDPARGVNIVYYMLTAGQDEDYRRQLDRYLLGREWDLIEPDLKDPDGPAPEDDPDWRPAWWKDD